MKELGYSYFATPTEIKNLRNHQQWLLKSERGNQILCATTKTLLVKYSFKRKKGNEEGRASARVWLILSCYQFTRNAGNRVLDTTTKTLSATCTGMRQDKRLSAFANKLQGGMEPRGEWREELYQSGGNRYMATCMALNWMPFQPTFLRARLWYKRGTECWRGTWWHEENFVSKSKHTLARMAQRVGLSSHKPERRRHDSQSGHMCGHMGSVPHQGTHKRQQTDVSVSRWRFCPTLPFSLRSVSMSLGED